MKKVGFMLISLMVVGLLAGGLEAQEFGGTQRPEWSGEIDMPYAYRDGNITTVLNGGDTEFDTILAPLITINLDWALADDISACLQLQNPRVQDGDGTDAIGEFAGGDGLTLAVEKAYIKAESFLAPELDMTIGIQDLKFTLREGEGAFFMDVAGANATGSLSNAVDNDDPVARDVLEFARFTFDYGSIAEDSYEVSAFWGLVKETRTDNGAADDRLIGVQVGYKLPGEEGNVLKVLLANIANAETDMNFFTVGGSVQYFGAIPNLEIYGDLYLQVGDLNATVSQAGNAMRVGGRYDFSHELMPYVDLSIWTISGDDDYFDDKGTDFISYENVQSTLILEDNVFGLDLDNNYTAIKVEAGIETGIDINGDGAEEPLSLKFLMGTFTLIKAPTGDAKALGTEIDLIATLHCTENLTFRLAFGMLSSADFFSDQYPETSSMNFVSFSAKMEF